MNNIILNDAISQKSVSIINRPIANCDAVFYVTAGFSSLTVSIHSFYELSVAYAITALLSKRNS